jgi:orotate phosphoribosyltransferase
VIQGPALILVVVDNDGWSTSDERRRSPRRSTWTPEAEESWTLAGDILTRMDAVRQSLLQVIREHSLQLGDFVLSSGKKSNYYLDCRTTTLHPRGALIIARLILRTIHDNHIAADAIGGLTLGADPIAGAVAAVSEAEKTPLPGFIVRKEPKRHGARREIEGWSGSPGSQVIVVDDVCTSGGSILEACGKVESAGYKVAATMCVVDREEGGTEAIRSRYPFYPIFTVRDLMSDSRFLDD